jgi:hypothetical protein
MKSYSFITWSRCSVQEMPFQSQGSGSKALHVDKTRCGSSYIASLKVVRAPTVQNPEFPVREFIEVEIK